MTRSNSLCFRTNIRTQSATAGADQRHLFHKSWNWLRGISLNAVKVSGVSVSAPICSQLFDPHEDPSIIPPICNCTMCHHCVAVIMKWAIKSKADCTAPSVDGIFCSYNLHGRFLIYPHYSKGLPLGQAAQSWRHKTSVIKCTQNSQLSSSKCISLNNSF